MSEGVNCLLQVLSECLTLRYCTAVQSQLCVVKAVGLLSQHSASGVQLLWVSSKGGRVLQLFPSCHRAFCTLNNCSATRSQQLHTSEIEFGGRRLWFQKEIRSARSEKTRSSRSQKSHTTIAISADTHSDGVCSPHATPNLCGTTFDCCWQIGKTLSRQAVVQQDSRPHCGQSELKQLWSASGVALPELTTFCWHAPRSLTTTATTVHEALTVGPLNPRPVSADATEACP